MHVRHILQGKGRDVVTTSPETTLQEAAEMLRRHRIGALVVTNDDKVAGIVSERDIVNAIAERGAQAVSLPVAEVMTRNVQTCCPEDSAERLMEIMTHHRVRHLPVMENGRLAGLVSIGDVVKQRMEEIAFEAEQMKMYIAS